MLIPNDQNCAPASISNQAHILERYICLVERCMHAFKVAPKHPHHLNFNLLFNNRMCIYQYNAILQHMALDVIKQCFIECYNCTLTSRNTNILSLLFSHSLTLISIWLIMKQPILCSYLASFMDLLSFFPPFPFVFSLSLPIIFSQVEKFKQDPSPSTCLHSIFNVHTGDEVYQYEEYSHLQVISIIHTHTQYSYQLL